MERERARARARVAQIRQEITDRIAELNELLVLLDEDDGGTGHRRFTIVRGDLGALLLLPMAALGRRPRHAVTLGFSAVVVGALALVLAVPGHTSPGGPGYATSYLSIPAVAPTLLASVISTPTLRGPATPSGAATIAGVLSAHAAPQPSPTRTPSAPPGSPVPSASASVPATLPTTPTSSPTAMGTCWIELSVTGIVDVCVL